MQDRTGSMGSRGVIDAAMVVLLGVIFVGASRGAKPIYLAVIFTGAVVLVSTAHLSYVIQESRRHGQS